MASMVFQFIGDTVTNTSAQLVVPTATNLIDGMAPVVTSGLALYIMITGHQIMLGAIKEAIGTLLTRMIRVIIITAFGLNIAHYSNYVIDFFTAFETGIASTLSIGNDSAANIYVSLDASFTRGMDAVKQCFRHANRSGISSLGSALNWCLSGLLIGIGTLVVTAIGGAMVIFSKFALGILFALGPLFFVALLFPVTAKFFDQWLAQIFNYIFSILVVSIMMSFGTLCYDAVISQANLSDASGQNPGGAAFQVLLVTVLLTYMIKRASEIAGGLSGGISLAAMTVGQFLNPVKSASAVAKNLLNPTSSKRDLQSGMMTNNSRLGHLMSGNTTLNPAYRQAALQNLGRNWGRRRGGRTTGS